MDNGHESNQLILLLLTFDIMTDQLQVDCVLESFNVFAAPLGLKLSWATTKLQNVGVDDPPLTILIDDVPVEGVEDRVHLPWQ